VSSRSSQYERLQYSTTRLCGTFPCTYLSQASFSALETSESSQSNASISPGAMAPVWCRK
jgi:hypothetical protein